MAGLTRLPAGLVEAFRNHQSQQYGRDIPAALAAEYLRSKGTRKSVEELADELYKKYYSGKVERNEYDKRMNLPEWRETYPGAFENVGKAIIYSGASIVEGAYEAKAGVERLAQRGIAKLTGQDPDKAAAQLTPAEVAAAEVRRDKEAVGYEPEATTQWEDVKRNWLNAVPFATHQLLKSTPDMALIMAAAPAWVGAHAGRIAKDRAEADGREEANGKDLAVGILTAAPVGALDKLALGKLFSAAGKGKHVRSLAEKFAAEPSTEFVQEAGETVGTLAGTERGRELGAEGIAGEAVSAGAQGAVAGAGAAVAIGAPSEITGRAALGREAQAQIDRLPTHAEPEVTPEPDATEEAPVETTSVDTIQMDEEVKLGKRQAIDVPPALDEVPPELQPGQKVMVADPEQGTVLGEVKSVTDNFINIVKPGTDQTIQSIRRGAGNRVKLFTPREADTEPTPEEAKVQEKEKEAADYRKEITRLARRVTGKADDKNSSDKFRKLANQPQFQTLSETERDAIDDKIYSIEQAEKAAKEAEKADKESKAAKKESKGAGKEPKEPEVEVGQERKSGKLQDKDYYMAAFTPDKVNVDPNRFQFKKDATGAGGTDNTFTYAKKWSDVDSGELVFWQDKKGKTFVVDGHQRTSFAKRLWREGDKSIALRGQVFKETDGWTAKEARLIGAKRNIRQAHGTAWDAGDVFRESPDELKKGGFPNNAVTRYGRDIAKLREDLANEAKNGGFKDKPNIIAVAGRLTEGKDIATQRGLVRNFIKYPPKSEGAAETQGYTWLQYETGKTTGEESLFGSEDVAESDFQRYADLTDGLAKQLNREGSVLSSAAQGRGTIERTGAGNINRALALRGAASAKEQVKIFRQIAKTKGPVSEAIRRGLAQWTDPNSKPQRAKAIEMIRDALESEYTGLGGQVTTTKETEAGRAPVSDAARTEETAGTTTPEPENRSTATTEAETTEGLFGPQPVVQPEAAVDTGQGDFLAQVPPATEKITEANRASREAGLAARGVSGTLPRGKKLGDTRDAREEARVKKDTADRAATRAFKASQEVKRDADQFGVHADTAKAIAGEAALDARMAAEMAAANHTLIKKLDEIATVLVPGDVEVKVEPALVGAQGRYWIYRKVIEVSLNSGNPLHTLGHETIHALRNNGMIRSREWKMLVAKAKRDNWIGQFGIDRRYPKFFKDGKPDDSAYEEAIAEGFATWLTQKNAFTQKLNKHERSVFERIREFFHRLSQSLRHAGYTDVRAEQFFEKVAKGEVARRRRDAYLARQVVQGKADRSKEQVAGAPTAENFSFKNPDLEKAMSTGEQGVRHAKMIEKIKDYIEAGPRGFYNRLTRHWRSLAEIKENADVIEKMRQLEASPQVALNEIASYHTQVMKGLTEDQQKVVSRTIFLRNLLWRGEMGLSLPKPFNLDNVKEELGRLEDVVEADPKIAARIAKRQAFQKRIAGELVKHKILTPEQIANPSYIHHQVLEYAEARARGKAGGTAKVVNPHWHKAHGSELPINFNYFEAEAEWLFKALTEIDTKQFLNWLEKNPKYNVLPKMREKANAHNQEIIWGEINTEIRAVAGDAIDLGKASTPAKISAAFRKATRGKGGNPELLLAYRAGKLPKLREFDALQRNTKTHARQFKEAYKNLTADERTGVPAHVATIFESMDNGEAQQWSDISGKAPIFEALQWAVNNPGMKDLAAEAGALLAINARRALWMKANTGTGKIINTAKADALIKAFPEDAAGMKVWQPDSFDGKTRAINFFVGKSINGHIAENLMDKLTAELERDPNAALPTKEISAQAVLRVLDTTRDALMVGGPKTELLLDEGLTGALNEFRDKRSEALIPMLTSGAMSYWKQYILLNPRRAFKYLTNNFTGDIDALISNEKFVQVAAKIPEAHKMLIEGMNFENIPPDLRRGTRKGVLQGGATHQEIRDASQFQIDDFGAMELKNASKNAVTKSVRTYFNFMQKWASHRENVVRLAAYLYYREQLVVKKKSLLEVGYGSTPPWAREGITSKEDLAAKMARDVMGDYGNLGDTGRWTRRYVIPFWAWMETNTTRYGNRWRNIVYEARDGAGVPRALRMAGKSGLGLALRTAVATPMIFAAKMAFTFLFTGLVNVWNNVFFGEDEENFSPEERTRLHLILYKNRNGEVFTMRFQGALSDVLGVVGAENIGAIMMELHRGRASWDDVFRHMRRAPFNKFINSISPVYKVPAELATEESWFPDFFEPQAIQDPLKHFARTFTLDNELAQLRGVLGRPTPNRGYGRSVREAFIYKHDPGETIYNTVRGRVYDYKRNVLDEATTGRKRGEFGETLYRYRKALQFDDKDAIKFYRKEILRLGAKENLTTKKINQKVTQSLVVMHPARAMSEVKFARFWVGLTPREKVQFKRAVAWYHKTILPQKTYRPRKVERLTIYAKGS